MNDGVFFCNSCSSIFDNLLKSAGFLGKAMDTCFAANLSSFQENFKSVESVAVYKSYNY